LGRHHAEGIFLCEKLLGTTITNSNGRVVPTRWVGEQYVKEDLGRIPTVCDWLRAINPEPWMLRAGRLSVSECSREGFRYWSGRDAPQGGMRTNGVLAPPFVDRTTPTHDCKSLLY
jgi:hypothetical protein